MKVEPEVTVERVMSHFIVLLSSAGFKPTIKNVMERVFGQLEDIKEDVEELKFPSGSKTSPARSCSDILIGHPDASDGNLDIRTS